MSRRIFCNGARVYFDGDAFARGTLRREEDTMSEQCEGCGRDISESGRVVKPCTVECKCGARYTAAEVVSL